MLSGFSSNGLILGISLVFTAIAFVLIFMAIREALADQKLIKARLDGSWNDQDTGTILRGNKAFDNFANHLTLPGEEEISKIRAQLARAGYYGSSSVKTYYAIRLLAIVGPQMIFMLGMAYFAPAFEPMQAGMISIVLIALGALAPILFVRWKESRRTQQNRNGFPDMMDLLVACIEAGLGMNAALIRVADEIGHRYPALKINLDLLNMELRAGRERNVGMMNFANRVNMEEARALAVMIRQSEEMGSSLGGSLRTFSDEMRNKRQMRAEEKAMALPAKMTVPLIFFIFPAIMAILLTPAILRLSEGLAL